MALLKCPDCGRDVSTEAATCPQCGRPTASFSGKAVQTQRKGGKYEALGFLIILAGMGIWYYYSSLLTVLSNFIFVV